MCMTDIIKPANLRFNANICLTLNQYAKIGQLSENNHMTGP